MKLPFIEQVHIIDLKVKTVDYDKNGVEGDSVDTSSLSASSKDLQEVWANVVVNYKVNPEKATDIFVQYKNAEQFGFNVIEPIIRQTVKSVTAQYTAEELVTKRLEISDKVNALLATEIPENGATLVLANLTNFDFSTGFKQAIEAKVTAVQNAEAQKNKLEQVKYEAQQTIEKAKAEAEAIRISAQAINSQGGADYVQLKAIEKWSGQGCTSYCGLEASSGLLINGR
jgi:prohibitin 2